MAAYVAQVVVSMVVAKIVPKIAEALGVDPKIANMLGVAAGMYAGYQVQASMTASASTTTVAPTTTADVGGSISPSVTSPTPVSSMPDHLGLGRSAPVTNNITRGLGSSTSNLGSMHAGDPIDYGGVADPSSVASGGVDVAGLNETAGASLDTIKAADLSLNRTGGDLTVDPLTKDTGMFDGVKDFFDGDGMKRVAAGAASGLADGYMTGSAAQKVQEAKEAEAEAARARWRGFNPRTGGVRMLSSPQFNPNRR